MKKSFLSQIYLGSYKNEMLLSAFAALLWAIIIMDISSNSKIIPQTTIINICYVLLYRGFLLLGWEYNLKGVRRGARILIIVGLLRLLFGNDTDSINGMICEILKTIGIFILFIDLLPLQTHINKYFVISLIVLKIGKIFLLKLGWLSRSTDLTILAITGFMMAYLFWEISTKKILKID